MNQLTALHAACGAGGITAGFEHAGIRTAFAFDLNPIVINTHRANFPDAPAEVRDLWTITANDLPVADVFTCGIPCEAYSIAGQRKGLLDERDISPAVARLLHELRPPYVFLENVPPFQFSPAAAMIRDALVGYRIAEAVFRHADYGVCQKRERWHLIAARDVPAPLPTATHSEYLGFVTRPWIRFREIRDPHPDTNYLSARAWRGIIRRQSKAEMRQLDSENSAYAKCYIVDDDDLMPTVLASWFKGASRNQATVIFDDGRFRAPTLLEVRRAQGFPDGFNFRGNQREIYEQIGRAVPPPFAAAVAQAIIESADCTSQDA